MSFVRERRNPVRGWRPCAALPGLVPPDGVTNPSLRDGVAGVESSSLQPIVRITDDYRWARANHRQTKVDDLFAQWESDPLQLLSFPDLGI